MDLSTMTFQEYSILYKVTFWGRRDFTYYKLIFSVSYDDSAVTLSKEHSN